MSTSKLSKEQELQLIEDYRSGMTVEQVRIKYGFKTRKSVTDKVKKYYPDQYEQIIKENRDNIKGYSYSFKEIKSEFEAYFLGLLLTDGYVTPRGSDVGIDLNDEDCIAFLSKTIGKGYKSYTYHNDGPIKSDGIRHRLILSLGSQGVKEAERFGLIPKKSLILPTPQLLPQEEKFIPYIVRGIIDGDGSVYTMGTGAPCVCIFSESKEFIEWIKYIFENKMYLRNIIIYSEPNGAHTMYSIKTADQQNVQKIIALCYNKPFGMMRKYNKLRQTFRDYNKDIFNSGIR